MAVLSTPLMGLDEMRLLQGEPRTLRAEEPRPDLGMKSGDETLKLGVPDPPPPRAPHQHAPLGLKVAGPGPVGWALPSLPVPCCLELSPTPRAMRTPSSGAEAQAGTGVSQ